MMAVEAAQAVPFGVLLLILIVILNRNLLPQRQCVPRPTPDRLGLGVRLGLGFPAGEAPVYVPLFFLVLMAVVHLLPGWMNP